MMMKPLPTIESAFSLLTEQKRQFLAPSYDTITLFTYTISPSADGHTSSCQSRGRGQQRRGGH